MNFFKKWNRLDYFIALFLVLIGVSAYFSVIHPAAFSNRIEREDAPHYAEADILLPQDLNWIPDIFPADVESRDVYGNLQWKILEFGREQIAGSRFSKVKVKMLIKKDHAGGYRFESYHLRKGNYIYLMNHQYVLQGYMLDFRILKDRAPL